MINLKRDVAIVILNYIQLVNVIPGINKLIKLGYTVDCYCPKISSKDGFDDMYNDTIKTLKQRGYKVYTKLTKFKYKVLLEPYPYMDILSEYKIRYRYGNISAKPDIVYKPENYLRYDAILCSGTYEANLLSVFSQTFITSSLLFKDFKKSKNKISTKKTLLYLPTYGKESSIDMLGDYFKELQDDYYIITKIHHGTTFLKKELSRVKNIKKYSDEFYDCKKDLCELLSIADVVLTDNSASIFDAIYNKIPVAVYCKDINENKLMNFNTTQYELYKKGILPYTTKRENIKSILTKSQSKEVLLKQNQWAKDNFCYSSNPVNDFTHVIETFLKGKINEDYLKIHEVMREKYIYCLNETNRIPELDNRINKLAFDNDKLTQEANSSNKVISDLMNDNNFLRGEYDKLLGEVKDYRKGKLYKLSKKIYELKGKLRWKKR